MQLGCSQSATVLCVGSLQLTVKRGKRLIVIGKSKFDLEPGKSLARKIALSSSGKKIVRKKRTSKMTVIIHQYDEKKELPVQKVSLTLRRR